MYISKNKKSSFNSFLLFFALTLVTSIKAQVPSITAFTPLSAKPGDAVTITGNNFNTTAANNIVFFGATRATVTSATATSITATVPAGATFAPITLLNTTNALACASSRFFLPIYSPAKPSITAASFSSKVDFVTGISNTFPYHASIGDLDGDGKADLVVANSTTSNVSVLRNTATVGSISGTSFASKVDFAAGTGAYFVAIGDIDGDGKLDLVIPNNGGNSVSILRNTSTTGNINFATKVDVSFPASTNPVQAAITDIDGDGKLDVVTVNQAAGGIAVLRNTSSVGNVSFAAKVDFATGTNPNSVSAGDFDGDGKFDLCVVNNQAGNVSVFRNTSTSGSISFATKLDVVVGAIPKSVLVGDIDGDGRADIAVANLLANTISIVRNTSTTGNLSFATRVVITLATGANPYFVNGGDLDGDGKLDLVTANFALNTASVLRNTSTSGTITFATSVDFTTGTNPVSVSIGDLDGDAMPDLMLANNNSNFLSVLRNADLSNNANLSNLVISAGTLTPTFSSAITSYTATVLNTTNSITVTPTRAEANATIQVRINNGTYTTVNSGSPSPALNLIVGNNIIDVLVTAQNGTTKTYTITVTRQAAPVVLNCPTNTTVAACQTQAAINTAFASWLNTASASGGTNGILTNNNTGAPAACGGSTTVTFTYNSTTAPTTTTCVATFTVATSPTVVLNCPVNTTAAAGQTQAAINTAFATWLASVTASGGCNGILTNNNTGAPSAAGGSTTVTFTYNSTCAPVTTNCQAVFTVLASPPSITSFTPLSAKPGDVVTITGNNFNTTASNNVVFFGATRATVTTASTTSLTVTVPVGATFAPITLLNQANGLATFSNANFTPIFSPAKTNLTTSDFAAKQDFTTGTATNPSTVAIGDLDGDGKADLVVANYNSGNNIISIFRNTSSMGSIGSNSFASKVDLATGSTPMHVAIGDLNGDGKLDLVVANNQSTSISVFRNTATTGSLNSSSFAAKVDFVTGPDPNYVAIGDLDGDGKPDLAVTSGFNNYVSVLRNTSTNNSITTSSFAAKVDFTTGSQPIAVAIGDIDGDGRPELVTANRFDNTISVFRNTATVGSITSTSFASKVTYGTALEPYALAMGDLDGDGKIDLVTANAEINTNNISVLRNTSTTGIINTTSFASKVDFPTDLTQRSVAIGDLNGDGKLDITTDSYINNVIVILRNTSTTGTITASSFATKVDIPTGTNPYSVAIGDLDGDGKSDLVSANFIGRSLSILRNTDIALPTVLAQFSVNKQNNAAFIKWSSQSEINAASYEVEKSTTNMNFSKIATVSAKGFASTYSLVDNQFNTNTPVVYYRLKMLDKDGKFTYSNVVKLSNGIKASTTEVYPTVTTGLINVNISVQEPTKLHVQIMATNGQTVQEQILMLQEGTQNKSIEVSKLSKGTYIVLLSTNQSTEHFTIIKQ